MSCEHGSPLRLFCPKCFPADEDGMVEIDIVRDQKPLRDLGRVSTMTCPCCGSDDTGGSPRFQVICWKCFALFREEPSGVHMVECMCGRHDNGKVVREVPSDEKE